MAHSKVYIMNTEQTLIVWSHQKPQYTDIRMLLH